MKVRLKSGWAGWSRGYGCQPGWALVARIAGYERANAACRRVVMSDACLSGMAFGLWRTTRSSSLTEQGSSGCGAAGPEALVSN
jgi:hypothetical protein